METSEDVGGYNYRFVDQLPEHYMCMICHQPSRDPYMIGECCQGQTMCKSCLDQTIRVSNSCPGHAVVVKKILVHTQTGALNER